MSNFTTELRFICENSLHMVDSEGYQSVNSIVHDSAPLIFDFDYPIFDVNYKNVLESKILKHYYTREIAFETVGRWKLALDARMNEIMPYYNQLYESINYEWNPFYYTNYNEEYNATGRQAGSVNDNGNYTITNTKGGTVGDVTDNVNTLEKDGTIKDEKRGHDDHEKTGNDETVLSGTDTTQKRGYDMFSGNKAETEHLDTLDTTHTTGEDKVNTKSKPINDRWEYFSDTPQGSIDNVADLKYLTNVKHITEDGEGSENEDKTTYGKNITLEKNGSIFTETYNNDRNDYNNDSSVIYGKDENTVYNTSVTDVYANDLTKTFDTLDTERKHAENTKTFDTTDTSTKYHTNENARDITTTDAYIKHIYGKTGRIRKTYAEMLKEYRETFLNIDMMVINELSDLFFGLYE